MRKKEDEIFPIDNPDIHQEANEKIYLLPVGQIEPNPNQPRRYFDPQELEDLAENIREKHMSGKGIGQTGIFQAITVRYAPGTDFSKSEGRRFQIVFGERRWRAAQKVGLTHIPAVIMEMSSDESFETAMIENLLRHDMTPLEEAQACNYLITERGYSYRKLAHRLGKTRRWVELRMAALNIDERLLPVVAKDPETMTVCIEASRIENKKTKDSVINQLRNLGGRGVPSKSEILKNVRHIRSAENAAKTRDAASVPILGTAELLKAVESAETLLQSAYDKAKTATSADKKFYREKIKPVSTRIENLLTQIAEMSGVKTDGK